MDVRFATIIGTTLIAGSIATLLTAMSTAAVVVGGIGGCVGLALVVLAQLSARWGRMDAAQLILGMRADLHERADEGDQPAALVG